ncbi:MAG: ATP-binding cassette domain-containing protein [Ruminococcaceae bacterium]|nr:ATP-binding cassette domain-containing protein [Oscillospiraceae bacterium]
MLRLTDVTFSVPSNESGTERNFILNKISLDIEDGRYIVVTGPNGGGKTTLAKAIMGIVKPESGKIILDGLDITNLGVTERSEAGISYGFQQPPRFKGMTVRDLLSIAANKKLKKEECCKYLTKVGLCAEEYLNREVDTSLSGGEVKRIEIATVLARGSKVMIFDEPEAGIDLWSFHRLTKTFREIHETTGCTLIIISHQERIISQADEVLLIADGKLEKRGRPEEILPSIDAVFEKPCLANE